MHKVALFNGKLIDADDAKVHALSSAALYGRGVFTTIAIYDGKPFLLEKHLRRLRANSRSIGLAHTDEKFDQLEQQLDKVISENGVTHGRARVTLFDASASRIWSNESEHGVDTFLITADKKEISAQLKLTVSPYSINSRSPLAGVKSCNYLENILAVDEANQRGFNEAIRSNERGEVASACMANVFWLKGEELFTPDLSAGCLAGTMRAFILENIDCREVKVGPDELHSADGVFLTSAGIGIRQVTKLDKREFERSDHEILKLLPPADKKTRMSAK